MNKKMVASVFVMVVLLLGAFASYAIAQSDNSGIGVDSYGAESVGVDYSGRVADQDSNALPQRFSKFVYGYADGSEKLDKYEAHCKAAGGIFNSCGSFCKDGQACIAVCAITCDNVPASENYGVYRIRDEEGKVEVEFGMVDSKNSIKYGETYGGYHIDTDLDVKNVHDGKVDVVISNGAVNTVKVFPEEAIGRAFGPEVRNVDIKLEEKSYDNIPKVVYKIDSENEGKFLGIFKIEARYQAEVDASTGEVLNWNGPWWAFLITGESSKPTVENKIVTDDEGITYTREENAIENVFDFDSCVAADYPAKDSYCKYGDVTFVKIIDGETEKIIKNNYEDSEYQICVSKGGKVDIKREWPKECLYLGRHYRQNEKEMKQECEKLGKVWKTPIYGGDAGGTGAFIDPLKPYSNYCISKEQYECREKGGIWDPESFVCLEDY